jgi:hypothetical protein
MVDTDLQKSNCSSLHPFLRMRKRISGDIISNPGTIICNTYEMI